MREIYCSLSVFITDFNVLNYLFRHFAFRFSPFRFSPFATSLLYNYETT